MQRLMEFLNWKVDMDRLMAATADVFHASKKSALVDMPADDFTAVTDMLRLHSLG